MQDSRHEDRYGMGHTTASQSGASVISAYRAIALSSTGSCSKALPSEGLRGLKLIVKPLFYHTPHIHFGSRKAKRGYA